MKHHISIGLIGIGGFGCFHYNAILELQKKQRVCLCAVADPTLDQKPQLRKELLGMGVRLYSGHQEMLDGEKTLDAVAIATPIPYHFEMAMDCIERGLYVYLEKPPAPLISQLDTLIRADRLGRVHVGFQMIGADWVQQIKTWIVEGRLGRIRSIRTSACWPRGNSYYNRARWAGKMSIDGRPVFDGPATNALSHLVHCSTYLAGSTLDSYDDLMEITAELYRARPIDSYDTVSVRGHFRSGTAFAAAYTHATQFEDKFHVHITGDKGWAHLSHDGRHLESSLGAKDYTEETDSLIKKSYRRFIGFIEGVHDRPQTPLADTRGYVLSTNGMLLSSGGIHTIPSESVTTYQNMSDNGYTVDGLHNAIQQTLQTGKLFSELDCPWAKPAAPVSLKELSPLQLEEALHTPRRAEASPAAMR